MIARISDKEKIKDINSNQTCGLLRLYKEEYRDISEIRTLEQVNY